MKRSLTLVFGLITALVVLQSCSAPPEKGLLTRYFHASSMNDNDTMSAMAIEPLQVDVDSWSLLSVSTEKIEPFNMSGLDAKEVQMKKDLENHVGPTMDAKDVLDVAKEALDMSRTAGAKAANKQKVDALQAKYDAEYQKHKDLQQAYNDAKKASSDEEAMAMFSLGVTDMPTIRSLTGQSHTKEVVVNIKLKSGGAKKFKVFMKKYDLKDEAANMRHTGRWIITRFERID